MEISEGELLKLPYRVVGNIDYAKTYPEIFRIPELSEENRKSVKNFNAVMKYIIMVYSYKTPLMSLPDYFKRREFAKEYSGTNESDITNATTLIIGYLRLVKSHKWSLFCVLNDSFYNIAGRLQADRTESGERSGALRTNLKGTQEDIETLYNELLNEDQSLQLRQEIMNKVEEDHLSDLRPESRVSRILAGKPALSYDIYQKKGKKKTLSASEISKRMNIINGG